MNKDENSSAIHFFLYECASYAIHHGIILNTLPMSDIDMVKNHEQMSLDLFIELTRKKKPMESDT